MEDNNYIKHNLSDVMERIEKAADSAGKKANDITLIAVTKTVDTQRMQAACDFGVQHMGENRVQEYLLKKNEINGKIFWHLIGQMQTNKVKSIIGGILLLQSLDRLSLAEEIEKQCIKNETELQTLIEINIAREESKAGIDINELDSFVEKLSAYKHIMVKGLMTVAPLTGDKEYVRSCFQNMYRQFERLKQYETENLQMQYLSMGMSQDYEEAILEGSNMLRIGSAIFGERPKK